MTRHPEPGIPSSYGMSRADYIKALTGPFVDLTVEQRRSLAAEGMDNPELWEARVFYESGNERARTDFFLPASSSETDARHRAWTCWHYARAGRDGEYLNPTLVVRNVDAEARRRAA